MNRLWIFIVVAIVAAASTWSAACAQQPQQKQPQITAHAIVTVPKMCCGKEGIPTIKEMSKISGIKRVAVDYKTRSVFIEYGNHAPSLQTIWDTAVKLKLEPTRLATAEGVFTERPVQR